MRVEHPTRTVLTGPEWLFELYNGYVNKLGTAKIQPIIDPDGKPIIGKSILSDPDWDLTIDVNGRPVSDWLEEIPHVYDDGE